MSVRSCAAHAAVRASIAIIICLCVVASAYGQDSAPILTEGFEGGFQDAGSCRQGVCNVPAGWGAWFIPRNENDPPGVNFQPQYDRTTTRVHSGASAQRIWTENATFAGGIYRVVNDVQVGSRVRFTIWGQVWSTNDESPISSRPSRDIRVKVGVDPLGGDNGKPSPLNGQVIWSPEQEAKDEFVQFSVEVEVRSPIVILYTYTTMKDNVRHNEVFWDDALLEYVAPPPTATPDPALAPATPTPEPENSEAAEEAGQPAAPAVVQPVTHTVQSGDTLSGIALKYGVSVDELLRNNPGVRPEMLQIGQTLIIKPGTTVEATTEAATDASAADAGQAPETADSSAPVVEATPTVGQVCVRAFFDDNGNGKLDDFEDLVPNIQFTITAGGNIIATYITNGVDEPHCFESLPNQTYTVAGALPMDMYVPTTPLNDTLQVSGAKSEFSLGLRRTSDGFDDVSATPTPRPPLLSLDGDATIGLLSLGGGALLLIGTVGFVTWAILQRRRL